MSLKVLIVDDEAPARTRLKKFLAQDAQIEIVGEASDGRMALEEISAKNPDVVFLDIEMPEMNGLEVAQSLGSEGPLVVFVTAFHQFALDAFEANACDYLVKPTTAERVQAT